MEMQLPQTIVSFIWQVFGVRVIILLRRPLCVSSMRDNY
jgi:hypothetical protein